MSFCSIARCLLLPLLLLVAACGELPKPFQPEVKALPGALSASPVMAPFETEPAAVVIQTPYDMPEMTGLRLTMALIVALRDQGVAAGTNPHPGSLTIAGTAETESLPNEIEVKMSWHVFDAQGKRVGQYEQRVRGRQEDWDTGNDRLVSRIAQRAAPPLAGLVLQRTGADPGTGTATAAATPDAAQGTTMGTAPGTPPGAAGGPPAVASTAAAPAGKPSAPPPPRVLVATVKGAPGDGNKTLTAAMRRAVSQRGFPLTGKVEPRALQVQGTVSLQPLTERQERIVITWSVRDSDNQTIGSIEQSNAIPKGALNGAWGSVARDIALAATEGVVELLNKGLKAQGQ